MYRHIDPDGPLSLVEAFATGDIARVLDALGSANREPATIWRRAGLGGAPPASEPSSVATADSASSAVSR